MSKYILFCFFSIILFSCYMGRKSIIDDYEVTWEDYYTQGREGFCIGCQVRGVSDSILEDIKSIRWNHKVIIAEKNTEKSARWFIFIAAGDSLLCGNGDQLIGPFSRLEIDSFIKSENISI